MRLRDDEAIRKALARYHVHMSRRLGFNDTYATGYERRVGGALEHKDD